MERAIALKKGGNALRNNKEGFLLGEKSKAQNSIMK